MNIFEFIVVFCHGNIIQGQGFHVKFGHVLLSQNGGYFAQTIGSEVETKDKVVFFNNCQRLSVFIYNYLRIDKFVGFSLRITIFDGIHSRSSRVSYSIYH